MPDQLDQMMVATTGELVARVSADVPIAEIDGVRYATDLFRIPGGRFELNRWFKLVTDAAGSLLLFSPAPKFARSDVERIAADRDACVKFIADLFDEFRHEHHPEHGYRGTSAMRHDLQSRIADLLKTVAPELAPQPLREGQDPPAAPQVEVEDT